MKDYFGYQNKNVVVTGASSGMGKATAEMLVDLGAKVYALDWNECDVKGIRQYVHVDLSKKEYDCPHSSASEIPFLPDSSGRNQCRYPLRSARPQCLSCGLRLLLR